LRWRALVAALLTGGSMVVPASAAEADTGRAFTFADRRITESSGLVDLGSVMVTTNDSGSSAVLFTVDPATGRTIGMTDFGADTVDVEALAPAGGRAVWVGDIGDNRTSRKSVSVYRVPVGVGRTDVRAPKYRLVYPRGARNAESLFTDRAGRLFVVTKSFFGGTVFAAPARLNRSRPNRLQPVGRVVEFATDAAMLPDGKHVIVRGPARASVYTFPQLQRVGSLDLPAQRQGEGISVGPQGRIRLSSEGARSVVREIALPAAIVQRIKPPAPAPAPSASASPSAPAAPSPSASASPSGSPSPSAGQATATPSPQPGPDPVEPEGRDPWLMWSIPGVIALGAAGIGLGLRRRSE
jgi:hypothetical protein